MHTQADLELQKRETGGPKFLPKFVNDLISAFPEKISAFPEKIFIYLPKFLMTSFFLTSIRGGTKILTFRHIHSAIITLSAPKGGQTPLPTSMGPWPDLPPLDPPLYAQSIGKHQLQLLSAHAYVNQRHRQQTV